MQKPKLTIWKAILLLLFPTLMSSTLYIFHRLMFEGKSVVISSYTTITIYEYIHKLFYMLIIIYGFKKNSFSFLWGRSKLTTHNLLTVFLLSVFFFTISPLLHNLNIFFTNDLPKSSKYETILESINYTILTIILSPIVEELLFKNIFVKLKKNYSTLFSIFSVSFFFTIIHFQGLHWHSIADYFLFSIVSCVIFLKTESIGLCIFFHFSNNLLIGISKPYNSFLYENIYTQQWYLFVLIFAGYAIIRLLTMLRT